MKIDNVSIWTYKFIPVKIQGLNDLPKRKKTTEKFYFDVNDIFFDNKEISIKIGGLFSDFTVLKAAVAWIKNFSDGEEHEFVFTDYSKTLTGRITDGMNVVITGLMVTVEFKIVV